MGAIKSMTSQSFPVCKSLSSPPGQPTRAQNRKLALLFRNAPVLARDLCLGRREQRGDVCLKVCDLSRQQVLLRGIPTAVGGMKVVSIASAAEAAPQFGAVAAGQRRFVGRGGLGRGGGGGGERPARAKRLYLGLQQCYLLFQSSLLLRQRLQFAQCGQPGKRGRTTRVRERREGGGGAGICARTWSEVAGATDVSRSPYRSSESISAFVQVGSLVRRRPQPVLRPFFVRCVLREFHKRYSSRNPFTTCDS